MRVAWGLGALLVASVALNLHLLRGRARSAVAVLAPDRRAGTRAASLSAPHAATLDPRAAANHNDALPLACPEQLGDLARRLDDAEASVESHLMPEELFARATASAALEARVRPQIDKALKAEPAGWSHAVECRADTCQITLTHRDGSADFDWMVPVQGADLTDRTGASFTSGDPAQDPITKEPLWVDTAYLTFRAAGVKAGSEILADVLARFRGAGAIARCEAANPADGYWEIKLDLDRDLERIVLYDGGTLAVAPVGACLRGELEAVIAATTLPASFTHSVRFDTVTLPSAR